MKRLTLTAVAFTVALSGCANIQQQTGIDGKTLGAAGGAAIGCVGGALMAKISGQNAAAGCAVGAIAGGLIGFEKARQEEIAAAMRIQQEAIAALGPLPPGMRINMEPIKTVSVMVTDKTTNQTKVVQSLDSAPLELPLSLRGTAGYDRALAKMAELAEKTADERGSADVDRTMTVADAKTYKFTPQTNSSKTAKGNLVTVSKIVNNSATKGVERVTVRARKLEPTVVS